MASSGVIHGPGTARAAQMRRPVERRTRPATSVPAVRSLGIGRHYVATVWPDTRLNELLGVRYPIVQAPMAGFTTARLVAAVSEAGGLGSFGGATLAPDEIRAALAEIRALSDRPFAVNLFAPQPPPSFDAERAVRVHEAVRATREELGLPEPGLPKPPGWTFEPQLPAVVEARPP